MNMNEIKQRGFGECGIACLAMVCGEKYEHIRKMFPDVVTKDGSDPDLMIKVLRDLRFKNVQEMVGLPDDIENRPAILTVPSLNHIGLLHYIVWDGNGNFLDPCQEGKRYPDDAYQIDGKPKVYAASCIVWDVQQTKDF